MINIGDVVDGKYRVSGICSDSGGMGAFNEGQDLKDQVEQYKTRYGYYPKSVLADGIYGTRDNRRYLQGEGVRYGGKPLVRPIKQTELDAEQIKLAKKQRKQDALERIPIEGKFGQGKNGYTAQLHPCQDGKDLRGMDQGHLPGDEPDCSAQVFVCPENGRCEIYCFTLFCRSVLVATLSTRKVWSGNH